MASRAETYRQKAKQCTRLAWNVADSYGRAQLRETAALWVQMAQSIEALEEVERKRAASVESDVGVIASRSKRPADPHMTLANMFEQGVHELSVSCLNPACSHEIIFSADDYAAGINLSWFRSRMICARCGNNRLEVRPNWKERPGMPDDCEAPPAWEE